MKTEEPIFLTLQYIRHHIESMGFKLAFPIQLAPPFTLENYGAQVEMLNLANEIACDELRSGMARGLHHDDIVMLAKKRAEVFVAWAQKDNVIPF